VERSTDGVNFAEIAGKVQGTGFVDTSAQANTTYTYRVRAENSGQFSGYSNLAQATTPQAAPIFTSLDINASQPGSTTVINNGTDYDVVAGGPAIYGSTDGFRYLYKQQTGDFDVKVRLNSLTADGQIAQAGLMARQSLDPSSANVFISASPDAGYRFKYRSVFGGQTGNATTGTVAYPNVWVRLKRAGSMFTGYTSADGINWTLIGWTTLSMSDPVYLGMAAAANATTGTTTAQFRGFSAV
jgi:regulation of enolase protein 1 (concanavalin A-like superfamily)